MKKETRATIKYFIIGLLKSIGKGLLPIGIPVLFIYGLVNYPQVFGYLLIGFLITMLMFCVLMLVALATHEVITIWKNAKERAQESGH